jgi:hypothetical protein
MYLPLRCVGGWFTEAGRVGENIGYMYHEVCYEATSRGTRVLKATVEVLFIIFHP